jgi:hypothetical protein
VKAGIQRNGEGEIFKVGYMALRNISKDKIISLGFQPELEYPKYFGYNRVKQHVDDLSFLT